MFQIGSSHVHFPIAMYLSRIAIVRCMTANGDHGSQSVPSFLRLDQVNQTQAWTCVLVTNITVNLSTLELYSPVTNLHSRCLLTRLTGAILNF